MRLAFILLIMLGGCRTKSKVVEQSHYMEKSLIDSTRISREVSLVDSLIYNLTLDYRGGYMSFERTERGVIIRSDSAKVSIKEKQIKKNTEKLNETYVSIENKKEVKTFSKNKKVKEVDFSFFAWLFLGFSLLLGAVYLRFRKK